MHQVLARKYRPRNFGQLVGQTHVARALENALTRGRLHHAYLFSGTRGVGKTTIARILAKCLNCETGITPTPCEQCSVCVAVNEGRFVDLIEIDAASRTRVEDTRELLDNVPYAPTQGRYKVYLIDEVHMLSTHSFNALLKTLEEPPEHVKFLFATTDPHKLPITIISRCLQFILRPLTQDEIVRHLALVLQQEQIDFDDVGLWQLAQSAQGSMRDALSLTDQAIAYGQGSVSGADVIAMLGLIDQSLIIDLLQAIHQQSRPQVAALLSHMQQQAIDAEHVLEQLIALLHRIALQQCLPQVAVQTSPDQAAIQQLAQQMAAQDIQLYYDIVLRGRADLALALTPEQGFSMCILRLLAFRPLLQHEQAIIAPSPPVTIPVTDQPTLPTAGSVTTAVDPLSPPVPSFSQSSGESNDTGDLVGAGLSDSLENQPAEQVSLASQDPVTTTAMLPDVTSDIPVSTALVSSTGVEDEQDQTRVDTQALSADGEGPDGIRASAQMEMPGNPDAASVDHSSLDLASEVGPAANDQAESTTMKPDQAPSSDPDVLQSAAPDALASRHVVQTEAVLQQSTSPELSMLPTDVSDGGMDDLFIDDPRQFLQPEPQILEGHWTPERWDVCLQQLSITPAVRGFLQTSAMSGEISGISQLHLPADREQFMRSYVPAIQTALQHLLPSLSLQVLWDLADEDLTPAQMHHQRQQRAHDMARARVLNEPAVKQLVQVFGAQLTELTLQPLTPSASHVPD